MRIRTPGHWRRRTWLAGAVVVAAAATGVWWTQRDTAANGAQTITATVTRGDHSTTVTATGTLEPRRVEELSFSSSGTVTAVRVAAGDRVHRGQVLARIDDDALVASREAAAAQLDAAQTQLDEDRDADASDTQLAADTASVAAARSQLAAADEALDGAVLRAPITGTVSDVEVAVGDSVGSAGPASSGSSTAAVTVVSSRHFVVDASVTAADVASVKRGMQVEITPTGATDTVYGTVSDVAAVAQADSSGAATFSVTVEVTGTPKGLYAGSSADLSIITKKVTGVLTVPALALHTDNGQTYVWVVDGDQRTRTVVTTGATYGMDTQITSGLTEGQVVELARFTAPQGGTGGTGGGPSLQFDPGNGPPGGFVQGDVPNFSVGGGK